MSAATVKCKLWTGEELFGVVSAVIYRKCGTGIRVSAEVEDRNGRTIYIVEPGRMEREEERNAETETE